jgi:Na+/phosphate symporter
MTDRNFKLISKYALLLSISYLLEFAFNRYVRSFNTDLVTRTNQILVSTAPYMLTLLLNIITSIIVYRDKVTQNIKTKYVILATVLYRPIGVVAFLLYSIYDKGTEDERQINRE